MAEHWSYGIKQKAGSVILAGAGPGDLDLITVRLSKALQHAEVIITDRLVNPVIIQTYASKHALILFAGKQGYNEASSSMEEINELMTKYALQGNRVLRLKGGDVAFFSNVLDELQNLVEKKIPFEIIPGITAAAGASAYAGIPLTARGYAQGVQFLTYYRNNQFTSDKWKQLAATTDTLVFYMSANHAIDIAQQLLNYGASGNIPLAIIEQATSPHQQVYITCLMDCKEDFSDRSFRSPSLVIIGKVVELHASFNWFKSMEVGTVFKELI
ncbi:MAG: uroporphyrinogen-III C-methyltransferase [Cyclobacteriaceae bacterium]